MGAGVTGGQDESDVMLGASLWSRHVSEVQVNVTHAVTKVQLPMPG
jgi:hypothetical protein